MHYQVPIKFFNRQYISDREMDIIRKYGINSRILKDLSDPKAERIERVKKLRQRERWS